ncbi:hypothetical protein [Persicirhabdus sediminis]|uniref:Uncharacterized protein n=1 Tax=Persicirhabdus sediminis TaxID=454144 RepID=A0A8J7MDE1_9BACT|nr:hypothetical protein [Persicirhabdus sediminis]MBK1791724.1 hypothetical protein [Persicirhabdus sediminis]
MRSLINFLSVILALSWLTASAQERIIDYSESNGLCTVTVTNKFDILPASGHAPIVVELSNGSNRERSWNFAFRSIHRTDSFDSKDSIVESSYNLSCPAGAKQRYELSVPLVSLLSSSIRSYSSYSNGTALKLDVYASGERKQQGSMSSMPQENNWPSALISNQLSVNNLSKLESELVTYLTKSSSRGHSSYDKFAGTFIAEELPSDWRIYSGFNAMLISLDEWRKTPATSQKTIQRWVEQGGQLTICDSASSLTTSQLFNVTTEPAELKHKGSTALGMGTIQFYQLNSTSSIKNKADLVMSMSDLADNTQSTQLANGRTSHDWSLYRSLGVKSSFVEFFVIILVLFALIVGPVNFFCFAKKGKRHRLFITTPAISIIASLLMIALILIIDGINGKGARVALVEVDPANHQFIIQQDQCLRAGVLVEARGEIADDVFISPIKMPVSDWTRVSSMNESSLRLKYADSENGKQLSGDWLLSRSDLGFYLEQQMPTRAKVELSHNNGQPAATSSFDKVLNEFCYRDAEGQVWWAKSLTPGKLTQLSKDEHNQKFETFLANNQKAYSETLRDRIQLLSSQNERFFALSDQPPFISSFEQISWNDKTSIITGKAKLTN